MNRGRTPTRQASEPPRRQRSLSGGRCSPGPKRDTIVNQLTKDELVLAYKAKLRTEGEPETGVENMTKKQIASKLTHDELLQVAEVLGFFSKPCPAPRSRQPATKKAVESERQTVRPIGASVLSARAPMAAVAAARADSVKPTALVARKPAVDVASSQRKTPFPEVRRNCDTCTYATKKTLVNAMKKDHLAVAILLAGDPEAKKAVEYALCSGDYEKNMTKAKLETMIKADQLRTAALEMVEDRQLTVPESVREELTKLAVRCNLPRLEAAKATAAKLPAQSIERQRLEHLTRQRPRGPTGRRAPGSVSPQPAIPMPERRATPYQQTFPKQAAGARPVLQLMSPPLPERTRQPYGQTFQKQAAGARPVLKLPSPPLPERTRQPYEQTFQKPVLTERTRQPYGQTFPKQAAGARPVLQLPSPPLPERTRQPYEQTFPKQRRAEPEPTKEPRVLQALVDAGPSGTIAAAPIREPQAAVLGQARGAYTTLRVKPDAEPAQIRKAYMELVKQPDVRMPFVNRAFDLLWDQKKRAIYNQFGWPGVVKCERTGECRRHGTSYLFGVLGVAPGAAKADINKSFRRASLDFHPDKGGDAKQRALVNLASDVLRDDERRVEYEVEGPVVLKADAQLAAQRAGAEKMAEAAAAPPGVECVQKDWYDCSDPCYWYFVDDPLTGECMSKDQYDAKMQELERERAIEDRLSKQAYLAPWMERRAAEEQEQRKRAEEEQRQAEEQRKRAEEEQRQLTECQKKPFWKCKEPCKYTGMPGYGECISGAEYKRRFPKWSAYMETFAEMVETPGEND